MQAHLLEATRTEGLHPKEEVSLPPKPKPKPKPSPEPNPNPNPPLTPHQACLISSLHGLTEAQAREADRWVELYEHHDKYHLVGLLRE